MLWNILICVTSSSSLIDHRHLIQNLNLTGLSEETCGWPSHLLTHEAPVLAFIRRVWVGKEGF